MKEYKITVEDKLKEALECGKKLDFDSVVSLIQNHPWEESKERLENDYEQAGAELCQAQHSLSLDLDTN